MVLSARETGILGNLVICDEDQRHIQLPPRCPYTQVLIAVMFGGLLGVIFGQEPYPGGITNAQLGKLGMIVAVTQDACHSVDLRHSRCAHSHQSSVDYQVDRSKVICLVNVTVAMTIGLVIANTWQLATSWQGHVDQLLQLVPGLKGTGQGGDPANAPIEDLAAYIPRTILLPFSTNNIIGVVLWPWSSARPAPPVHQGG